MNESVKMGNNSQLNGILKTEMNHAFEKFRLFLATHDQFYQSELDRGVGVPSSEPLLSNWLWFYEEQEASGLELKENLQWNHTKGNTQILTIVIYVIE